MTQPMYAVFLIIILLLCRQRCGGACTSIHNLCALIRNVYTSSHLNDADYSIKSTGKLATSALSNLTQS